MSCLSCQLGSWHSSLMDPTHLLSDNSINFCSVESLTLPGTLDLLTEHTFCAIHIFAIIMSIRVQAFFTDGCCPFAFCRQYLLYGVIDRTWNT